MEKTMEKSLSIHDPPEGCIHITVKIFLQLSRDFFVQKMGYIQVVFWCTAVASRHKHRICEVHKKKTFKKNTTFTVPGCRAPYHRSQEVGGGTSSLWNAGQLGLHAEVGIASGND